MPTRRRAVVALVVAALIGCGAPVRVRYASPRDVHRGITGNVLSTGELSRSTANVLFQWDLVERYDAEPEAALATLHDAVAAERAGADAVFALAELAFHHAERTHDPRWYLASAVYAWAFLFPEGADEAPHRFDPRLRVACDLYNRGLTGAFTRADRETVALEGGPRALPFGAVDVAFDPAELEWADRRMVTLVPVAELEVEGLAARHRGPGLGAPLAADTEPAHPDRELRDFLSPRARIAVTALLHLHDARRALGRGRLSGELVVYPAGEQPTVHLDGREVPLELEHTAALAWGLSQSRNLWEMELGGFFAGDFVSARLFKGRQTRLVFNDPYQPGRFPVVLVHGTASSPGRWAEMLNDLANDPRIRQRFNIWFFFYDTGNPIVYSAAVLRENLRAAVAQLDPEGRDAALHRMIVIGHSQGGLLARLTAVDAGTRLWDLYSSKPLDELTLKPDTREKLRRTLLPTPLPFVRRVVYIATPHRGSYIAGNWLAHLVARFVRFPGDVLNVTTELMKGNASALTRNVAAYQGGSVFAMTPGNPFLKELVQLPVGPGIVQHSIIAVDGDGEPDLLDDGVVDYASAHLDDVASELVVRSPHSCQANPNTIAEVRRILLLHTAEAGGDTTPGEPPRKTLDAPGVGSGTAR